MLGHAFLAILFCSLAAPANEGELANQVKRLVRQLNEPELAEREAAEKGLVALGAAALAHLPEVNERTPAEIKKRLENVRQELEKLAVEEATKASRVTLAGELTLADALAALEKQSRNKIAPFSHAGQIQLNVKDAPFWEAFDQVLDAAQLTVNPYGRGGGALELAARLPMAAPRLGRASYSGVFRFEPTRITAVRDLRNPQVRSLRLALEVAWEPRVSPIALEQSLAALKATGDDGQPLAIDSAEGNLQASLSGGSSATEFELPLTPPARGVKKIARLQGTLQALIPGRVEMFTFEKLAEAKNAEQKRAGVVVVLREMRKNQELYEVRILVRYNEAANALESHRGWIDQNEAYLLNAQGKKVEPAAFETGQRQANEQAMSFLFALEQGPAGCKFVYHTPAALVKMPVPYELKDIELP